jgi:LPS export ABC transporter protein LptC
MIVGVTESRTPRSCGTRLARARGGARVLSCAGRQAGRVALGLLLLALLGGGCGSEPAEQQSGAGETTPQQVVQGMRLRQSEGGRVRWELTADSAMSYGENERTHLYVVRIEFHDAETESLRSTLTAREGEIEPRTEELMARGNVVVTSREGRRLETEELRWDPKRSKVLSDLPVRMTKGKSVITGTGIEADPDLGQYEIRSPVEGELREEDRILDEF